MQLCAAVVVYNNLALGVAVSKTVIVMSQLLLLLCILIQLESGFIITITFYFC